jgi:hypothetical protein
MRACVLVWVRAVCVHQLVAKELEKGRKRHVPLTPGAHELLRMFLRDHASLQALLDLHVTLHIVEDAPRYWRETSSHGSAGGSGGGGGDGGGSDGSAGGSGGDGGGGGGGKHFVTNVLNRSEVHRGRMLPPLGAADRPVLWGVPLASDVAEVRGPHKWEFVEPGTDPALPKYTTPLGTLVAQVRAVPVVAWGALWERPRGM